MIKMGLYKDLLKMSKEAIDSAMIPARVKKVKKQADFELAKLEEKIAVLEARFQEACSKQEIDFNAIMNIQDDCDLLERKKKQLSKIISGMFNETS